MVPETTHEAGTRIAYLQAVNLLSSFNECSQAHIHLWGLKECIDNWPVTMPWKCIPWADISILSHKLILKIMKQFWISFIFWMAITYIGLKVMRGWWPLWPGTTKWCIHLPKLAEKYNLSSNFIQNLYYLFDITWYWLESWQILWW